MLFEKIQLESDEKILTIVHKHWFVFALKVAGVLFLALLPVLAWLGISTFLQSATDVVQIDLSTYTPYFLFFYCVWLLGNWIVLALMYTDYYLDIWVITDRRIISIDQLGLFRRQIGSFRLEKLQDINIAIDGIIATFLNFGMVEAQTASGSEEEFRSFNLPRPRELKSIILKAADERMKTQTHHRVPST